jgi:hypothetical protein
MIASAAEEIGGTHYLGIGMTADSAFELLNVGRPIRIRLQRLVITIWVARSRDHLQRNMKQYDDRGEHLPVVWLDRPAALDAEPPPQEISTEEPRVESTRNVSNVLQPTEFFLKVLERLNLRTEAWGRGYGFDRFLSPSQIKVVSSGSTHPPAFGHIERAELEAVIAEVLAG